MSGQKDSDSPPQVQTASTGTSTLAIPLQSADHKKWPQEFSALEGKQNTQQGSVFWLGLLQLGQDVKINVSQPEKWYQNDAIAKTIAGILFWWLRT